MNTCIEYRIASAKPDEIGWIAGVEAKVFSAEDAVPEHLLMGWYNSNPGGFNIIRMANGLKVGHVVCLPLRPASLEIFLEGHIVEKDIRGDSLFTVAERHLIRDIYVESLIVQPPKDQSHGPAILRLLNNFGTLLGRVCDPSQVENVYAMAASKSGDRFLRRLGFSPIPSGGNRADRHEIFHIRVIELARNISAICGRRFPEDSFSKNDGAFTGD